MVINKDLNFLPANFKATIIYDIELEYRYRHHNHDLKSQRNVRNHDVKDIGLNIDNSRNIITLDSDHKSDLQKIKLMIKDILINRRIRLRSSTGCRRRKQHPNSKKREY